MLEFTGDVRQATQLFANQMNALREELVQPPHPSFGNLCDFYLWYSAPSLTNPEVDCLHDFRGELLRLLHARGCADTTDCAGVLEDIDHFVGWRSLRASSKDGQHQSGHPEALRPQLCALLALASPSTDSLAVDWYDQLPPPETR